MGSAEIDGFLKVLRVNSTQLVWMLGLGGDCRTPNRRPRGRTMSMDHVGARDDQAQIFLHGEVDGVWRELAAKQASRRGRIWETRSGPRRNKRQASLAHYQATAAAVSIATDVIIR